jgi:hypothetical protein
VRDRVVVGRARGGGPTEGRVEEHQPRRAGGVTALQLQRRAGNRAVRRLIDEGGAGVVTGQHGTTGGRACSGERAADVRPEPGRLRQRTVTRSGGDAPATRISRSPLQVQRLMGYAAWMSVSARTFASRDADLKAIDASVKTAERHYGRPEHTFGLVALNTLQARIATYRSNRQAAGKDAGSRAPVIVQLETSVNWEIPRVTEMRSIQQRLLAQYGITLDNQSGEDAIRRAYGRGGPATNRAGAAKRVLGQLKQTGWQLEDLRQIEQALSVYSPLLGPGRSAALGAQPITSFSSLAADIEGDSSAIEGVRRPMFVKLSDPLGIGKTEASTYAETFTQKAPPLGAPGGPKTRLANISMFDYAHNVTDFAGDPHNPTQAELTKGYRGTVIHELCHGLVERLTAPVGGGKMIDYFVSQTPYWQDRYTKSGTVGAERPVTGYARTNANEDLAETLMYFFEDPTRLNGTCPQRFGFVRTHLRQYLSPQHFLQAQVAAGIVPLPPAQGPPPPVAGPAAPAAAGPPVAGPPLAGAAAAGPGAAGPGAAAPAQGGITAGALVAALAALRPVPPAVPPLPPGGLPPLPPLPGVGGPAVPPGGLPPLPALPGAGGPAVPPGGLPALPALPAAPAAAVPPPVPAIPPGGLPPIAALVQQQDGGG